MTSFTFQTDQPGRELVSSEGEVEKGCRGYLETVSETTEVVQVIDGSSEQWMMSLGS